LLASASRDRLIHVFSLEKNYSLEQTLNDHSASITAVKFTGESPEVRMTADGLVFSRRHHVVEKTTLYDMDLDPTGTRISIACQDRHVRVYNVETGKLEKCLKGSASDEGALLKVQMDPSGSFFATSCSDKNITIFDSETGECVATLFGHSEPHPARHVQDFADCLFQFLVAEEWPAHCVFVWRLDSQMTGTMRKRRARQASRTAGTCSLRQPNIRWVMCDRQQGALSFFSLTVFLFQKRDLHQRSFIPAASDGVRGAERSGSQDSGKTGRHSW
ncbi:hypothetical protein GOODEAATRI_028512, partial [Goodea atripinnis]